MGSRLLNGSPQLSVRVTLFPLILIVLLSIFILGTIAGTPVIKMYIVSYVRIFIAIVTSYLQKIKEPLPIQKIKLVEVMYVTAYKNISYCYKTYNYELST